MPWENCVVTLNSDSTGSFYTGDIVTGTVFLEFKHSQKIETIEFLVTGTIKAQWTRPSATIPHIKFYSEKKKVLHIEIDLFDDIKGKTLSPGTYTYPFHFVLPDDLPSSFESSMAKVRYCIKMKSCGICSHKKVIPFTVLGNVNINHIERYLEPCAHEIRKICRNANTLTFRIKTYVGFASKQSIPFDVTVKNPKNVKLLKFTVTLLQKLHYSITEGYMDEEKKKCKYDYDKFNSSEEEKFSLLIDIPHVTPSSTHIQEPIIDISYAFRVAIKFMFHSTIYDDLPVTVATVPVIHHDFIESDLQ